LSGVGDKHLRGRKQGEIKSGSGGAHLCRRVRESLYSSVILEEAEGIHDTYVHISEKNGPDSGIVDTKTLWQEWA
jgi:hypothetical protein